ncbi:1,25-dihydroxyvitamin D(3) 24-hydroxylase, mitochondrial-like isoform X2 [Mytilus edulis]|uniref:1,25-dihydroxyvitamin D(3) 24-hydroxylase, mitochondrial-like isoform X2 n=1 Tax=Mytilus edulis TaxID=6550 RepID=UPI0039EFF849
MRKAHSTLWASMKSVQKIITPLQSHFRSSLRRTSTIASTTAAFPQTDGGNVKTFSELPGPTGLHDIPYLGMALNFKPFTKYEILDDFVEVMISFREKYGDIFKVRAGNKHVLHVCHPDIADQVFRLPYKENHRHFPGMIEAFYKYNDIPRSLSMRSGKDWAKLRMPSNEHLLKPKAMANFTPLLERVANDFVDNLKTDLQINDAVREISKYAYECVGIASFNKRYGCLNDSSQDEMLNLLNTILKTLQTAYLMPFDINRYYKTKTYREFEQTYLQLQEFLKKNMEEQILRLNTMRDEGTLMDYLQDEYNLIYAMLSDGKLPAEEIVTLISDLHTGAVEGLGNAITFVLCDLALNPDKQDTLYEEITQVAADQSVIGIDALQKMSYLQACIKESQRLTAPFPGALRIPETDVTIAGYRIPKGTNISINHKMMSLDERFFPQPTKFLPERWTRDDNTDVIDKGYQNFPNVIVKPFGFGVRSCAGVRVAKPAMMLSVAKIIQNFEVSLPNGEKEIKTTRLLFPTPKEPVNMCLKPRQSSYSS